MATAKPRRKAPPPPKPKSKRSASGSGSVTASLDAIDLSAWSTGGFGASITDFTSESLLDDPALAAFAAHGVNGQAALESPTDHVGSRGRNSSANGIEISSPETDPGALLPTAVSPWESAGQTTVDFGSQLRSADAATNKWDSGSYQHATLSWMPPDTKSFASPMHQSPDQVLGSHVSGSPIDSLDKELELAQGLGFVSDTTQAKKTKEDRASVLFKRSDSYSCEKEDQYFSTNDDYCLLKTTNDDVLSKEKERPPAMTENDNAHWPRNNDHELSPVPASDLALFNLSLHGIDSLPGVPFSSASCYPRRVTTASSTGQALVQTPTSDGDTEPNSQDTSNGTAQESLSSKGLDSESKEDLTQKLARLRVESSSQRENWASICCGCAAGIPFDSWYTHCSFCWLSICSSCTERNIHVDSHRWTFIKLTAQRTIPGTPRKERLCHRCERNKHARFDCLDCEYSVCEECYAREALVLKQDHEHYTFWWVQGAGRGVESLRAVHELSQKRQPPSAHSYCSACLKWLAMNEPVRSCRACTIQYDVSAELCQNCHASVCHLAEHGRGSNEITFISRVCSMDEYVANRSSGHIVCLECHERFRSPTDRNFGEHPHRDYVLEMTTSVKERLAAMKFRQYPSKTPRTDLVRPRSYREAPCRCFRCGHEFSSIDVGSCTCGCNPQLQLCWNCVPHSMSVHSVGPESFYKSSDARSKKTSSNRAFLSPTLPPASLVKAPPVEPSPTKISPVKSSPVKPTPSKPTRSETVPVASSPATSALSHPRSYSVPLNEVIYATLCCHCGSGIPFPNRYAHCVFCSLDICERCITQHPSSHARDALTITPAETLPMASRDDRLCVKCRNRRHVRIECTELECGFAVCDDCRTEAERDGVFTHAHQMFVRTFAPRNGIRHVPRQKGNVSQCCAGVVWAHCSSCVAPLGYDTPVQLCRICMTSYDDSIALCPNCQPLECRAHGGAQDVFTIRIRVCEDSKAVGLELYACTECRSSFGDLRSPEFARHPHQNYEAVLPHSAREMFQRSQAVNCPWKLVKPAKQIVSPPPCATRLKIIKKPGKNKK